MFTDKVILITGGTGSFGQKCAEILLEEHRPKKLIIFSRDELKQFEMSLRFPLDKYRNIRFFIGDVRDKERLQRAFQGVDYIIHAAAMKQIPAAEYNPTEVIKTNIYGAQNIINVAADRGVKKVLALSTDKAVSPVNLYGATKLCSDKLFVAANAFTDQDRCLYSVVRYGNVLGSRGSVVPLFFKLRDRGVLPVTDPRMTRFWITLDRGVRFVLECMERMVGGEIVVPKLPSMNIMDLAKAIAPECKTEVVGIRPGEKLHELMISKDDARNIIDLVDRYLVIPQHFTFSKRNFDMSASSEVPADFEYSSGNNTWWLTVDEMRQTLREQGFTL